MRTLTQYLETWARTHPERPLFTFLNRACDPISSYTYAGFHARTNGLARVLADEIGVAAGEPILLVYPPGLEMITAFMACVKAGAIPVPVSAPAASAAAAASERLSLICASAGASRVLTDTSFLSTIAAPRPALEEVQYLAKNQLLRRGRLAYLFSPNPLASRVRSMTSSARSNGACCGQPL